MTKKPKTIASGGAAVIPLPSSGSSPVRNRASSESALGKALMEEDEKKKKKRMEQATIG
jgi:hypothetical protein